MNLGDLKYSNSLYALRAVSNGAKTIEEIASAIKSTQLTANKIVSELVSKKILAKFNKRTKGKCGRPNIYYGFSSHYYSAVIVNDCKRMYLFFVFANGNKKLLREISYENSVGKEAYVASELRYHIGCIDSRCISTHIIGDNLENFNEIENIEMLDINELLSRSFSDDEKAIFIEHDGGKILNNHSKARVINLNKDELESIIDIDEYHSFIGKTKIEIILSAMVNYIRKLLEEKI